MIFGIIIPEWTGYIGTERQSTLVIFCFESERAIKFNLMQIVEDFTPLIFMWHGKWMSQCIHSLIKDMKLNSLSNNIEQFVLYFFLHFCLICFLCRCLPHIERNS